VWRMPIAPMASGDVVQLVRTLPSNKAEDVVCLTSTYYKDKSNTIQAAFLTDNYENQGFALPNYQRDCGSLLLVPRPPPPLG